MNHLNFRRFVNIHTALLLVFVLMIGGVVYRFFHWGMRIDKALIDSYETTESRDTFDLFLPLMDKEGNNISTGEKAKSIVCFGNSAFADDRGSKNNLANLIAAKTGATVYNCSISGSYLSSWNYSLEPSTAPQDTYSFFWLCQLMIGEIPSYLWDQTAEALGENAPEEAQEVYDTLTTLDFHDVDTIVIMYDASDYYASRPMFDDNNYTDIESFTGNLEAGIEVLQDNFPWIRIIVMSPTYAYAVDEQGKYVSSDLYTYGWDILSTYVIKESESSFRRSVSFVDHFYGTVHEDNAKEYLIDNMHLNKKGRELVANRFVQALTYYDE